MLLASSKRKVYRLYISFHRNINGRVAISVMTDGINSTPSTALASVITVSKIDTDFVFIALTLLVVALVE